MNEVPSIGGARGIFEIFVPGAFLFLNIVLVVYAWPINGVEAIRQFIFKFASQPVLSLATLICFGYLLGVLLRLLKCKTPDKLSGYFGWLMSKLKGKNGVVYLEEFPYFSHIEKVANNCLPENAKLFYQEFWGKKIVSGNREFFNYCKTIINSVDDKSATEIYAAEALTRYVAGMFYALLTSFILVTTLAIVCSSSGFWVLASSYLLAIVVILRNLRFLRVKEVELVFTATLQNYFSGKWPKIKEMQK